MDVIHSADATPCMATIAMLRHIASGKLILASAVHLFWNPKWPDVKAMQASLLCDEISRARATSPASCSVVIAG